MSPDRPSRAEALAQRCPDYLRAACFELTYSSQLVDPVRRAIAYAAYVVEHWQGERSGDQAADRSGTPSPGPFGPRRKRRSPRPIGPEARTYAAAEPAAPLDPMFAVAKVRGAGLRVRGWCPEGSIQ